MVNLNEKRACVKHGRTDLVCFYSRQQFDAGILEGSEDQLRAEPLIRILILSSANEAEDPGEVVLTTLEDLPFNELNHALFLQLSKTQKGIGQLLLGTTNSLLGILSNGLLVLIFVCFLLFGGSMRPHAGIRGEVEGQIRKYIVTKVGISGLTAFRAGIGAHVDLGERTAVVRGETLAFDLELGAIPVCFAIEMVQ